MKELMSLGLGMILEDVGDEQWTDHSVAHGPSLSVVDDLQVSKIHRAILCVVVVAAAVAA